MGVQVVPVRCVSSGEAAAIVVVQEQLELKKALVASKAKASSHLALHFVASSFQLCS